MVSGGEPIVYAVSRYPRLQFISANGRRTGNPSELSQNAWLGAAASAVGSMLLRRHGRNKEKTAEYLKALTYDRRIWKDSIDRRRQEGPPGQPRHQERAM